MSPRTWWSEEINSTAKTMAKEEERATFSRHKQWRDARRFLMCAKGDLNIVATLFLASLLHIVIRRTTVRRKWPIWFLKTMQDGDRPTPLQPETRRVENRNTVNDIVKSSDKY